MLSAWPARSSRAPATPSACSTMKPSGRPRRSRGRCPARLAPGWKARAEGQGRQDRGRRRGAGQVVEVSALNATASSGLMSSSSRCAGSDRARARACTRSAGRRRATPSRGCGAPPVRHCTRRDQTDATPDEGEHRDRRVGVPVQRRREELGAVHAQRRHCRGPHDRTDSRRDPELPIRSRDQGRCTPCRRRARPSPRCDGRGCRRDGRRRCSPCLLGCS